ncbi:MAG TPA: MXAN_2562 family outer membrane beta-barrel protein [Polyangiaceae bacterium]|nr:MXAN_2562 family outer membrane beta-barrel protein [Polyangiaceae bacterium]
MKSALTRALPLAFLGLVVPGIVQAHEDDGPPRPRRWQAPTKDPSEYRSDQNGAFEFRIGPYRPRIDEEFNGGATPFQDSFGSGQSVMFGIETDWQIFHIPHFGSIGPGVGVQFVTFSGNAPFADGSGISQQPTSIWILPMYGVGVLRIDVLARDLEIPFVPYIKGGITYALWEARDAGATTSADGVQGLGAELGYQLHAGGMLLLNFFAPQMSLDMDAASGVNNGYLFWEWMYSDVNSFGRGMQVGASTWVAGVAIEF